MEKADFRRADGRTSAQLREIRITVDWLSTGEGNVLIEAGNTRVLCVASFTEGVPRWRLGQGAGWVSAEYSMLPRATNSRSTRESVKGKVGGRTQEISRLIGRSLRGGINMEALGENTMLLDCDVLQADGGTRTAAITGAWIALERALKWGGQNGLLSPEQTKNAIKDSVCAVSVGIIDGHPCLDLPYEEDVRALTDMNVVCTGSGKYIEIQGTAEGQAFSGNELDQLLGLARQGCSELTRLQQISVDAPAGATITQGDLS